MNTFGRKHLPLGEGSLYDFSHRHLLLKLDKQIGGTIYWPFLAMNKA